MVAQKRVTSPATWRTVYRYFPMLTRYSSPARCVPWMVSSIRSSITSGVSTTRSRRSSAGGPTGPATGRRSDHLVGLRHGEVILPVFLPSARRRLAASRLRQHRSRRIRRNDLVHSAIHAARSWAADPRGRRTAWLRRSMAWPSDPLFTDGRAVDGRSVTTARHRVMISTSPAGCARIYEVVAVCGGFPRGPRQARQ